MFLYLTYCQKETCLISTFRKFKFQPVDTYTNKYVQSALETLHLFNICKVNRESRDVENILSFLSSPFVSRVSRDKRFITENYTSDNIPLYIQHNHLYSVVTTGILCCVAVWMKTKLHFILWKFFKIIDSDQNYILHPWWIRGFSYHQPSTTTK